MSTPTPAPLAMRPSRVLRKLRAGEVVVCYKSNFNCVRAYEIPAMSGFDCIWTCSEHTGNTYIDLERFINTAKIYDTDIVVRVPRGSYSDYVKPLELDAAGIMVPHCMNAADAKAIAHMTRFHPIGLRAADSGNADGKYCSIPFPDYIAQANRERFVIVQIEDPEAVEDLDGIAAVEGIDMIFFGPGDYSQALGVPGQMDDPRIADARKKVAEAARRHGKFAGTVGNPTVLPELVDLGYQFVNIGGDVVTLGNHCRSLIAAVQGVTSKPAKSIY